jgi:hypothetical protein
MALEIVPLSAGSQGPQYAVDRHLYLTEDKSRVVEESDPASRWLWATPGMQVPLAEAERLGAVKADGEAEPVEPVEAPKQRAPAQNKQRKPRENKAKDETETPPAEEE